MTGKYWDYQINPVAGCTPISEACAHCYAKELHQRFHFDTIINSNGDVVKEPVPFYSEHFDKVTLRPEQLERFNELARMKKPKVVFIGNLCDLFHKDVPFTYIEQVFDRVWSLNCKHTFIFLTKRAQRMKDFFEYYHECNVAGMSWPEMWDHVWIGVTAENQHWADTRIPILASIPAENKFISAEPILGPIDLMQSLQGYRVSNINLVIAGGESGREARPLDAGWLYNLKDQCKNVNIPFYFKQWGDGQHGLRWDIWEQPSDIRRRNQVLDHTDYAGKTPFGKR